MLPFPKAKKGNFLLLMGKYLNYINNNVYKVYNKIKKICMQSYALRQLNKTWQKNNQML